MTTARWMTAGEAARRLGVSRATVYAYVSRGLIHSQPLAGSVRAHAYAREDVERLERRTAARRDPAAAAAHALEWGGPVLESAITFIDGRALYYRGHDAVRLARTASVADVASLIWTGAFGARFDPGPALPDGPSLPSDATFVHRAQIALAAAASDDPAAADLRTASVTRAGWRMLRRLTDVACGRAVRRGSADETIDGRLARAWGVDARAAAILRASLILCADHELNVSSFTARCVASAGATPYAVVIAGLSALEGFRHGGAGARVAAMLEAIHVEAAGTGGRVTRQAVRRALAARLRRGEPIQSVGHPLYPDGDPRALALLSMLRGHGEDSAELAFVDAVAGAAASLVGEAPNVDFALAAVGRVLGLAPGAALQIFAIGRTIGWIGQALEQYATGQLIRPRARYVGIAISCTSGTSGTTGATGQYGTSGTSGAPRPPVRFRAR